MAQVAELSDRGAERSSEIVEPSDRKRSEAKANDRGAERSEAIGNRGAERSEAIGNWYKKRAREKARYVDQSGKAS